MILVGEIQEPTWDTSFLKDVEKGKSIWNWQTVVLGTVNDQHGCIELQNVFWGRWVPATIVIPVGPEGTVELYLELAHQEFEYLKS